jgi:hypothetical protein
VYPNFSLGGGANTEIIYNFYFIKKYVMKTLSKSPNRRLVGLRGKLKLTEKNTYSYVFIIFSKFHCASHQPISVAYLG